MTQNQKSQINLIQVAVEEKLNEFHKKNGESLNSREILNQFIQSINFDFDKLIKDLEEDNYGV